jgi:VanZ family protein
MTYLMMIESKRMNIFAMFIWLCLIWVVSTLPADVLPRIDALKIDKLEHFVVYFILGMLVAVNYRKGFFVGLTRPGVYLALIILACFDESHQYFCINRVVSVFDLSANILGISASYFILKIMSKRK